MQIDIPTKARYMFYILKSRVLFFPPSLLLGQGGESCPVNNHSYTQRRLFLYLGHFLKFKSAFKINKILGIKKDTKRG